jgi:OOP family OmpA-OmpF porin
VLSERDRRVPTVRAMAGVIAAALTVTLTACQADEPTSVGVSRRTQTSGPAGGARAAGRYGTMGNGRDIPAVPEIVVPDVTTLTKSAEKSSTAFGELAGQHKGVIVTGAVCDRSGRVTNGSSMTVVGGDGSGSIDRGSLSVVNHGDGSGTFENAAERIVVHGDGSGTYEDGSLSVVNHGDGSGTYEDGSLSVVNHGDGSGTYEDGALSEERRMDPLPR